MIQVIYCNLNGQVETITMETLSMQQNNTPEHPFHQRSEILDIYQFSKYIIDPNKHRFKT